MSSSILPPGHGLIDRLGDANTRIRDAAKETLVQLGLLASEDKPSASSTPTGSRIGSGGGTGGGKDEPASAGWDLAIKEQGLKNKNPKIREQVDRFNIRLSVRLPD